MKENFAFLFGFDIEKVKIVQMVDCNAEIYNTKNPVLPRDFCFFNFKSVVFVM